MFACLVVVQFINRPVARRVLYKYGDAIISKYAAACSAAVLLVLEIVVWVTYFVNEYHRAFIEDGRRRLPGTSPSNSPQAWPFDFPGAHAIARCAATEEGRTSCRLKRRRAYVLEVVEEAESSVAEAVIIETARRRVGRVAFSREAPSDAIALVAAGCGMAAHGVLLRAPDAAGYYGCCVFFDGIACAPRGASGFVRRVLHRSRGGLSKFPVKTVHNRRSHSVPSTSHRPRDSSIAIDAISD